MHLKHKGPKGQCTHTDSGSSSVRNLKKMCQSTVAAGLFNNLKNQGPRSEFQLTGAKNWWLVNGGQTKETF